MAKKTNLLVYVDADVMKNPAQLFDAAITHMIRKEVDISIRRQFIVEYQRAVRQAQDPIAVIHEWMQVRDVAGFPFRNKLKAEENGDALNRLAPADEKALDSLASGEAGIRGAKAGAKLRKVVLDAPGTADLRGAKLGTTVFYDERDTDESKDAESKAKPEASD